jgi:Malic enzyme, N-terminal domain
MYFSLEDKGEMKSMVYNWPEDDVDVIVVTDGSRVLGLGDLGSNSASIPIGKLALYVAGGGINPRKTLPVVLDFGTENEALRNDPLYLGLPVPRVKGPEYFALVDEWMKAMRSRWPNALIQFEGPCHQQPPATRTKLPLFRFCALLAPCSALTYRPFFSPCGHPSRLQQRKGWRPSQQVSHAEERENGNTQAHSIPSRFVSQRFDAKKAPSFTLTWSLLPYRASLPLLARYIRRNLN